MKLPIISVIVIGYKRPNELKKTVESFLKNIDYPRDLLEMILCDDGSPDNMKKEMKKLDFDKFLFANKNAGIGFNTNKGLNEAKGEFIVQLQDDWIFQGAPDILQESILAFREFPDISMIRYRKCDIEAIKGKLSDGREINIYKNDVTESNLAGDYPYTDNPHIKRSEFHKVNGYYLENAPMHKVELNFCKRVAKIQSNQIAYIKNCDGFLHIGNEKSFNTSVRRQKLIENLCEYKLLKLLITMLRKIKNRYFMKL